MAGCAIAGSSGFDYDRGVRGPGRETAASWPFDPGPRFELCERVGAGGFGDVFEAFDHELEMAVALKMLRSPRPSAAVHLKREFRALADVAHPNLLTLYELFISLPHSFFTMELVRGSTFIEHVRGPLLALSDVRPIGVLDETLATSSVEEDEAVGAPPSRGESEVCARGVDEDRLRAALLQIVRGLSALHATGKLHRDIKPSNVLVAGDGHVLVSDFGLVTAWSSVRGARFSGTAAYAAPEQALGSASPASDWYSVGCMLFEALTGELPFTGQPMQVLAAKQQFDAPRVSGSELGELTRRLLSRDPAKRPSGAAILSELSPNATVAVPLQRTAGEFVGRRAEIEVLLRAVAEPGLSVVQVVAPSGVGKSSLLERLRALSSHAVWLSSRCHERETVPFNAVDGLVDALCDHVATWPRAECEARLPAELGALARIFPSVSRLTRAPAVASVRQDEDGDRVRTAAFAGLRALFACVARDCPTVAVIDDMQWADRDSRLLLDEIFASDPPPLTLVIASREPTFTLPGMLQIALEPLGDRDAAQLAASLLGSEPDDARTQAVVREAGGYPLFIRELACGEGGAADLDDALWRRVGQLDPGSREMVALLSLAGEAFPSSVIRAAAGLEPIEHERIARRLCVEGFARRGAERGRPTLETSHDRVREAVEKQLAEETRIRAHHALADALVSCGSSEKRPRLVMHHLEAAGDLARAGLFAEKAARQAEDALAFDNAAELYAAALRLRDHQSYALRRRLADALRAAGRGPEAAAAYLAIADEGDETDRWLCRQRAGEQLLTSGHISEGIATLDELLRRLREPLPTSNARAVWQLARERISLRRRGYGWQERAEEDGVAEHDVRRLEVLRSVAFGLGIVDNLRGAIYSARALRLALDLGIPTLVAEALGTQAIFEGSQTNASRVRGRALLERVRAIADEHDDPAIHAWLASGEAVLDAFDGVPDAPARMKAAAEIFREQTIGNAWNENSLKIIRALTMRIRGEFEPLRVYYDEALRDARRQNNRYMECMLLHGGTLLHLVADDLAQARESQAAKRWDRTTRGMHIQHVLELESSCLIALYAGEGGGAFRRHGPQLRRMFTSLVMRVQRVRVLGHWLCGTLACADGARWAEPIARYCAARLAREGVPYAHLFAQLLRVSIALRFGRDAGGELRRLERMALDVNWPFYVGVARLLLARTRGDEGAAARAVADLRGLGVVNPVRLAAVFVPSIVP